MAMIVWWLFGYAIAYGHDNVFVGGQYYWAFSNVAPSNFSHFWANYAFAATSLSVALGAWAERVHMLVYLAFAFIWVGARPRLSSQTNTLIHLDFQHPLPNY